MAYIKDELEVMLKEHPKNEAKKTELQLKIETYEERLYYAGTVHEDTDNEVIEMMQLGAPISDMPKSNTNKIADTTGNTAMNYEKEKVHINKEDRSYLENKIEEFKALEKELDKKIVRVKNLLQQLSEDESFVIRAYYMKKSKWDYVEREYFSNYEIHKSIKQLQTYRDNALENMLEILNYGEG